jgi:hypothetical protein
MWKMKIVNQFGHVTEIENPVFIPRNGERIIGVCEPTPIVDNVIYNYANKEITVFVH